MRILLRTAAILAAVAGFIVPSTSSAARQATLLSGFPTFRQQHSLTCESSAASMGTRGAVTESQIMAVLPRRANPNVGFRGNPDGVQGTKLIDYGVYAGPVQKALARYGYASTLLSYASDKDIRSSIDRGWPVVAWITYNLQPARPRLAEHAGVPFVLVPHEHAVLIIGYDGGTVYANDPWNRKVMRYYWSAFNRSWAYFGDMGLSIQPCLAPQPVSRIDVTSVANGSVTWTWPRAANAAHYDVTVTKHARATKVVYHAVQDTPQMMYSNAVPGAMYEISVVSLSSCNGSSTATSTWVQMPAAAPTGTGTPSTTPAPETTGTPVAPSTTVPTPSATVTPSAVSTATHTL